MVRDARQKQTLKTVLNLARNWLASTNPAGRFDVPQQMPNDPRFARPQD
jgi:hypothetical protein